jgi:hypothetical protein
MLPDTVRGRRSSKVGDSKQASCALYRHVDKDETCVGISLMSSFTWRGVENLPRGSCDALCGLLFLSAVSDGRKLKLGCRAWPAEQEALPMGAAGCTHERQLVFRFNSFGNRTDVETPPQAGNRGIGPNKLPGFIVRGADQISSIGVQRLRNPARQRSIQEGSGVCATPLFMLACCGGVSDVILKLDIVLRRFLG